MSHPCSSTEFRRGIGNRHIRPVRKIGRWVCRCIGGDDHYLSSGGTHAWNFVQAALRSLGCLVCDAGPPHPDHGVSHVDCRE